MGGRWNALRLYPLLNRIHQRYSGFMHLLGSVHAELGGGSGSFFLRSLESSVTKILNFSAKFRTSNSAGQYTPLCKILLIYRHCYY